MWPFASKPKLPFFGEDEALAIEIYNRYAEYPVSSGWEMVTTTAQKAFLQEIKNLRK